MKVSFDIDVLLEEISKEDTKSIIALIDDPDVLDYIVEQYVVTFCEDREYVNMMVRCILNNHKAKDITIEKIAKCIKDGEISSLHAYRTVNHPNATENTKKMMEEFI